MLSSVHPGQQGLRVASAHLDGAFLHIQFAQVRACVDPQLEASAHDADLVAWQHHGEAPGRIGDHLKSSAAGAQIHAHSLDAALDDLDL